jgi:hypothetical protein
MSRKKPMIATRLQKRAISAASTALLPSRLAATRILLEDFKAIDNDWRETSPEDREARQSLYWAQLAALLSFLGSQGQESPALGDFIDALQNTISGVADEERLKPPPYTSNPLAVNKKYALAQVIAAINKAPTESKRKVRKAGAAYLSMTPKQVRDLVNNYHYKGAYKTLHAMVAEIEDQIDLGHGPDLDQLRDAGLLG